jgi:hypothetical protein
MVKHFRTHLAAISNPKVLDLIYLAGTQSIGNAEARSLLKMKRTAAWAWLARLTQLGLLEKRGNTYRATEYALTLMASMSLSFRSIATGTPQNFHRDTHSWRDVLKLASEGLELLYARGRMDQPEYARQQKLIRELETQLAD